MLNIFNGYVSLSSVEVSIILDGSTAHNPNYKYKSAILIQLLTGKRPTVNPCDVFKEGTSEILFNGIPNSVYLSSLSSSDSASSDSASDESDVGRKSEKEKRALLLSKFSASNMTSGTGKKQTKIVMTADDYRKATSSHSGLKISSFLRNPEEGFEFIDKLREFYLPDPSFQRIPTKNNLLTHSLSEEIDRDEMLGSFTKSNSFVPLPTDVILRVKSKLRKKLIAKHSYHQKAFRSGDNPLSAKTTYVISPADCLKFPDVEGYFDGLSEIFSAPNPNPFYIYIRPHLKVHLPEEGARKTIIDSTMLSCPFSDSIAQSTKKKVPDTIKMMTYFLGAFFNPFSYRLRVSLAPQTREQRLELMRPTGLNY